MKVIADLTVVPLGVGISLSKYVAACEKVLEEAGLEPFQALRAAGINAAEALGLGLRIGRIAPGAAADLVIVDGDPLATVEDAIRVVAVIRNGRFFSAIGLIELAERAATVE